MHSEDKDASDADATGVTFEAVRQVAIGAGIVLTLVVVNALYSLRVLAFATGLAIE